MPGNELDVDARARAAARRCARRPSGCPGTAYDDLAVLVRGVDDAVGDRRVHRVEVVAAVVEQVERLELDALAREIVDRGMARGAHEADRDALERGARGGEQQVGAGRAEPDHDDARLAGSPARGAAVVGGRGRRRAFALRARLRAPSAASTW